MGKQKKNTRSISFKKSGKGKPAEKSRIHPRSQHHGRYDLKVLTEKHPPLAKHVAQNIHGNESVDFADPEAVKALNTALLLHHYDLTYWDIPEGYLCPPIPGRADYIHHMADVLCASNFGRMPKGHTIRCIDIGTGANCIYPIVGSHEYSWSFIGTDIDQNAINSAQKIIDQNSRLQGKIELRLQKDPKDIFYGALRKEERVDLSICNPPFHASAQAANEAALRKVNNLGAQKTEKPVLNFGGKSTELWTEGGERRFIRDMVRESKKFSESCFWFSTLVSKEVNLKGTKEALNAVRALDIKVIPIGQGNKTSRIIAWTFLTPEQQKAWKESRWK